MKKLQLLIHFFIFFIVQNFYCQENKLNDGININIGINNLLNKVAFGSSLGYFVILNKRHEICIDGYSSSRRISEINNINKFTLYSISLEERYTVYTNEKFSIKPSISMGYGETALQIKSDDYIFFTKNSLRQSSLTSKFGIYFQYKKSLYFGAHYRYMYKLINSDAMLMQTPGFPLSVTDGLVFSLGFKIASK